MVCIAAVTYKVLCELMLLLAYWSTAIPMLLVTLAIVWICIPLVYALYAAITFACRVTGLQSVFALPPLGLFCYNTSLCLIG